MAILTASVTENLSMKEPGTISLPWSRILMPEQLAKSDSRTRVVDTFRSAAETLGVSTADPVRSIAFGRSAGENLGLSTADPLRNLAYGRTVTENTGLTVDRSGYSNYPLATDLVAWWNMDEASGTRRDTSPNGYDLDDNGSVLSLPGKRGDAASFTSGAAQFLSRTGGINFAGTDFSLCCWVKLDSLTNDEPNDYIGILSSGYSDPSYGWVMSLNYMAALGRFEFRISDGSATGTSTGYALRANNFGAVSTGTWYFIAVTYNWTTRAMTISVNGTSDSGTASLDVLDPGSEFAVGRGFNLSRYDMSGIVDGVGLWNRVLNSSEISELYNSGAGINRPTSDNSPDVVTDYRRQVTENFAGSNAFSNQLTLSRLIAETLGISTNVSRIDMTFARLLAETIGASTDARGGILFNRVLTDRFGLSNAASTFKNSPVTMAIVTDRIGASTGHAVASVLARRLSERVGQSNSVSRAVDYLRVISDSTIGMAESDLTWDKDHSLIVAETIRLSTSETAGYFTVGLGAHVAETIGLQDSFIGSLVLTPFSVTIVDRIGFSTASAATFLGVAWTRTVSENLGASTGQTREVLWSRLFTETAAISTTFSLKQDWDRTLVERLTLSTVESHAVEVRRALSQTLGLSTVSSQSVAYGRQISDTIGQSQGLDRVVDVNRIQTETVGLTTAAARAADFIRALQENLGLRTSAAVQTDLFRVIAETCGFSDAATRGAQWARSFADTVGFTTGVQLGNIIRRAVIETAGLSQSESHIVSWTRRVLDTIGAADLPAAFAKTVQTTLAERLGVSNQTDRSVDVFRSLGESLGLSTASPVRETDYKRALSSALGISDAAARKADADRVVSENLSVADQRMLQSIAYRVLSDLIGTQTAAYRGGVLRRLLTEALGLSDGRALSVDYLRLVSDRVGAADGYAKSVDFARRIVESLGFSDTKDGFNTTGEYRAMQLGTHVPGPVVSQWFVPGGVQIGTLIPGGV